jgi:murein DD-endopeptidase MepM/ murein hydrolase activator NlpD
MSRMRNEILKSGAAVLGVAAVCAMPALAAERERLDARFGVGRIAAWAQEVGELKRRALADGPFAPVVGRPDLGTAENAFGAARSGHVHAGQDLFAPAGTPLVAVTDSVVVDVGSDGGQGNYAHLYDPERDRTYAYMHMISPPTVRSGERVDAGSRVGGIGCSGSCWGDHLHFEVRAGRGIEGEAVDPLRLLRRSQPLPRPR